MDDYEAAVASSDAYLKQLLRRRRLHQAVDLVTAVVGLAVLGLSGGGALGLLGTALMLYGLIGFRLASFDAGITFLQDELNLLEVKIDRIEGKIQRLGSAQ